MPSKMTKSNLIAENEALRSRVAELEQLARLPSNPAPPKQQMTNPFGDLYGKKPGTNPKRALIRISYVDKEQRLQYINKGYANWSGFSPEALKGKHIKEAIGSLEYKKIQPRVTRVLCGDEQVFTLEGPSKCVGFRRVAVYFSPDFDGQHRVVGFFTVVVDITERAQAEEELRRSQRMLQSVVDSVPHTIVVKDLESRYLMVNKSWCESYGVEPQDAIHKHTLDIPGRPEHDKKQVLEEDQHVFNGDGQPKIFDHTRTDNTGRIKNMQNIRTLITNENGEIEGLVAISLDVTERKRAEEELRASQRLLQAVFDTAPIGVQVKDLSGRYLMVNSHMAALFGQTPHDLPGKTFDELGIGTEQQKEQVKEDDRRVIESGKTLDFPEALLLLPDGKTIWRRRIKTPLRDDTGAIIGIVGVMEDITVRKHAEEALRASELKYRNLFEYANDAIFIIDPLARKFLDVNENACKRLGYTKEELLGLGIDDIYSRTEMFKNDSIIRMLMKKRSLVFEHTHLKKNGTMFPVEISTRIIEYEGCEIIQSFARDITQRKLAEEELRKSEQRFRGLIENSLLATVVLQNLKPVFTNQAFVDLFQYESLAEVLDLPDITGTMILEESERQELQHFDVLEVTRNSQYERMGVRKDGSRFWVEVLAEAVDWVENRALLLVFVDITKRKLAEEERSRLITAVGQTSEGVFVTDADGTIQYVNPALERITGYAIKELLGKNPRILKSGKQDNKFYLEMWATISNGTVWEGALTNRKKDGSFYEEEMTISPIRGDSGEIINYIAVVRDITERKQREKQFEIQREQLNQADRMATLGTLVAGVAHEINNPNNLISLNVPILAQFWEDVLPILDKYQEEVGSFNLGQMAYGRVREEMPKLLRDTVQSSWRIRDIVVKLKNFTRSQHWIEYHAVDINEIVDSAVALLSGLIKEKTNRLEVQLTADIPMVRGNFQEIEQVVINLISNACEALSTQKQGVRISTSFDSGKGRVLVDVADEGEGIEEINLNKIMDPFFTTKRESGGTGLGLAISYNIVSEHGGVLNYSSSVGRGTIATLKLPAMQKGLALQALNKR